MNEGGFNLRVIFSDGKGLAKGIDRKAIRYSEYGTPDVLEYLTRRSGARARRFPIASGAPASSRATGKVRAEIADIFPISLPTIPGRDGAGRRRRAKIAMDQNREQLLVTEHVEPGATQNWLPGGEMTIPKPPNTDFAAAAMMHAGSGMIG